MLRKWLAEIENQRRRFEKEIKDAFEFGSFNFAKESLAILDNLQRAREAIKNDEKLKTNKDQNNAKLRWNQRFVFSINKRTKTAKRGDKIRSNNITRIFWKNDLKSSHL